MFISAPNGNLPEAMNYFLRECSKRINLYSGRINHVFGGPYHWSLITHEDYYSNAFRYVVQNPLRAGICKRVEKYPFSTIMSQIGECPMFIPLHDSIFKNCSIFTENPFSALSWLNDGANDLEYWDQVRAGLKKREFRMPEKRSRRRPFLLRSIEDCQK